MGWAVVVPVASLKSTAGSGQGVETERSRKGEDQSHREDVNEEGQSISDITSLHASRCSPLNHPS